MGIFLGGLVIGVLLRREIKATLLKIKLDQEENKNLAKNTTRFYLKSFIPKDYKEEIQGDLAETKVNLLKEGRPAWQVSIIIKFHYLLIEFGFLRIKIRERFTAQKKIGRDR